METQWEPLHKTNVNLCGFKQLDCLSTGSGDQSGSVPMSSGAKERLKLRNKSELRAATSAILLAGRSDLCGEGEKSEQVWGQPVQQHKVLPVSP